MDQYSSRNRWPDTPEFERAWRRNWPNMAKSNIILRNRNHYLLDIHVRNSIRNCWRGNMGNVQVHTHAPAQNFVPFPQWFLHSEQNEALKHTCFIVLTIEGMGKSCAGYWGPIAPLLSVCLCLLLPFNHPGPDSGLLHRKLLRRNVRHWTTCILLLFDLTGPHGRPPHSSV